MASITLTGTLLDPTGEVAVGDQIRFTHRTTTGETIQFARSVLIIPPNGLYNFTLEFGLIFVEYLDVKDVHYKNLGVVTVNGDTTATDLPGLLNAIVPPTDAQLLLFQGILADTEDARDIALLAAAQQTTLELIASTTTHPAGTVLTLSGHTLSGDGGGGKWKLNGVVGQTPSQSPTDLSDFILNDGNGNQWALVDGVVLAFNGAQYLPLPFGATGNGNYAYNNDGFEKIVDPDHLRPKTLAEAAASTTASEFDYIDITDRGLGRFQYLSGQVDNTYTIISAAGSLSLVWQQTLPIIAEQIGIVQAAADNSAAMLFAEELAISLTSKIALTIEGTYRSVDDRDLSLYVGIGFIVITGFTKQNTFEDANQDSTKPMMLEKGSGVHVGGEGRYTAFFGGATFQGSKLFFGRNGEDHISSPTKIARYIIDENGAVTKGVLKDILGDEMEFVDFRDANLGLQRSLTQGPVLSGSELVSPGVYQHHFMKLNVGDFDVNTFYNVAAFPSDEFMWGNAVQSKDEFWLKCTYGVSGPNLNVVHLYRATSNGSDPASWVKIKDSLFTAASECTLAFWEDRLVAITRSEPQTNPMQMRWTYDLEGADGWSDVVNLPFEGAAPSMIPYIPRGEPIVLHISVLDGASGFRVPIITSTPNLIDWTNISSGQFKNFTGSGAYGALVSSRNGYGMVYYEEVGAVDMQTRVWYVDVDTQTRIYPNADLVSYISDGSANPVSSCVLPSGRACLGDIGSATRLLSSISNNSFLEIIPKRDISFTAFVSIMSAASPVSTTVTLTGGALNIASSSVSINQTDPTVFEFPLVATLLVGVTYRFTFNVSAKLHGRMTTRSRFKPIDEDYINYRYISTNIEGTNFNEFVISHGLRY